MTQELLPLNGSTPPAVQEPSLLSVIERIAMNPDADISKLEKMLEMQERILNRNAQRAFTAAFAEMQAELPEISQRASITHSNKLISKYARFEDINESVKPTLVKYGFGVSFRIRQEEGKIVVSGVLSHREGHSESTEMVLPADTSGSKNNVQAIGSSVSYGKRYVLCALLNISTRGEDDDASSASAKVSQFQAKTLLDVLMDCSQATQEWFAGKYSDVSEVLRSDFTAVLESLKKARAKAQEGGNANH